MPSFTGGNLSLTWGFVIHEDGWEDSYNLNFQKLDALVHLTVLEVLSTPPGSPAAEDTYIVGASATGAWAGQDDKVAVFTKKEDPDSRAWVFFTAKEGWRAFNIDTQTFFQFDGAAWNEDSAAGTLFDFTAPAENDIIVYDATATKFINVRPMRAFGFGSDPASLLTADQEIFYVKLPCDFTIPADFGDYRGSGTTFGGTAVADDDVVFRLQKADAATPLTFVDVGEITIGIGTVVVSLLDSSAADIEALRDDVLRILAPTVPDATFKGPFGSLVGYEPEP
jgi:hypothetical protein